MKVTAIEVNHGDLIRPAYGYVIEFDGKKVVLSGDTKFDKRIAAAAVGADLLIHDVAVIEPALLDEPAFAYRDIQAHHTLPEEAGRIFSQAKPKLAVYSHIVYAIVKPVPDIPKEMLLQRTRTTYTGPLLVGRDLVSFVIDRDVGVFDQAGNAVSPLEAVLRRCNLAIGSVDSCSNSKKCALSRELNPKHRLSAYDAMAKSLAERGAC